MNLFYQALLFAFVSVIRADSSMFSQFIGATTVPATFTGDLVASATICTNYLHGLPNTSGLPASAASQVFQQEVDGVCQFCTSLGQTRVDSCCGQASSSVCFASFGGDAQPVTTTAPSVIAPTAMPTAVTGATVTSTKSGSDAERSAVVRTKSSAAPCLTPLSVSSTCHDIREIFFANARHNLYTGESYSTSCRGNDRLIAMIVPPPPIVESLCLT
jgi:hypothetical protein